MAGTGAAPGNSAGGLDSEDPALVGRVAAGLRWTLGILVLLFAAFPGLLSSIFMSWVTRPVVMGLPLGEGGSAQLHLGAFPWIVYLAMHVAHARLLRRGGAFPWSDGEVAAMALVPFYNLYGSWQLFDAAAAGARRAGGSAGLAFQIRAAAIAGLALACLQIVLLLGRIGHRPGFAYLVASADWESQLNAVALILLATRIFLLWRLDAAFRLVVAALRSAPVAVPGAVTAAADVPPPPPPSSGDGIAARFAVAALAAALLVVAVWSARSQVFRPGRFYPEYVQEAAHDGCDAECIELRRLAARARRSTASPAQANLAQAASQAAAAQPAPAKSTAAPAAPRAPPPEVRLAAGRTSEWWQDRLRALAQRQDEEGKRLYALTRERAQADGLRVLEGADGPWVSFGPEGSKP